MTLGHFSRTYGTFAARIKFPGGAGMWPAFWLLGDNGEARGEIKAFPGWPGMGMYIILNLAAGGSGGGKAPASTKTAAMLVDWVRVAANDAALGSAGARVCLDV